MLKLTTAEAHNEIKKAEEEAARIRDGKGPKKPAGPGDPDGDEENNNGDGNGNGGGNGGNGNGGGGGCCCSSSESPEAVCVFVRSDKSVWAWDRREQAWKQFSNSSEIVEVEFVKGGILAVAKAGAALFDCGLGIWLSELSSSPEELVDGSGKP